MLLYSLLGDSEEDKALLRCRQSLFYLPYGNYLVSYFIMIGN